MSILLYFAQVSLYAAIMSGIYAIVWRNSPLHSYSRAYLLSALVLPALLPFIHIPVSIGNSPPMADYSIVLPGINISSASVAPSALVAKREPDILACIYLCGCMLITALYCVAYLQINKKLKKGQVVKHNGYTIITGSAIGPGTIGKRIFFPSNKVDKVILRHELAHIQSGHRHDSVILQLLHVLFWVSPAHWLIGRELKTVHEFEADQIASSEMAPADYASILLSHSFSTSQSIVITHSFFHHPLKRRIMMLQKMKTPKKSILLVTSLILTVGFMSTVLLAQTKKPARGGGSAKQESVAGVQDKIFTMFNAPLQNGEIRNLEDGTIAFKTVDEMPRFNGSFQKWLMGNIRISDTARLNSAKGRCLVQFTVAENGKVMSPKLLRSSGDQLLDDEVVRLISSMPGWKPGIQKGRPVPVIFTMPVYFNLNDGC